ncbi:MAG TPA: hypothetical protein VM694_26390, partial [Polyangium sp.]|nr:hypothetical protein [Polyangium sp.]
HWSSGDVGPPGAGGIPQQSRGCPATQTSSPMHAPHGSASHVCTPHEVCVAGHTRDCCGMPPAPGGPTSPLDQWLCSCDSGEWTCWVLFPAASACVCSSPDGG